MLGTVGLSLKHASRFPHEFSGGQRQRIGIPRALAPGLRLIVADEPVSARDVSIQTQVVNLFADLQQRFGLTYVFIAHDLSVVRQISTRIAVTHLGKIVEVGEAEDVVRRPVHPYAEALLSSVSSPVVARGGRPERIVLLSYVPSPLSPPSGCRFHTPLAPTQPTAAGRGAAAGAPRRHRRPRRLPLPPQHRLSERVDVRKCH